MEAARRDDGGNACGPAPLGRQIFIPVDRGAFLKQRQVRERIDAKSSRSSRGSSTAREQSRPSSTVHASEFEVFRCLILFPEDGEILPLTSKSRGTWPRTSAGSSRPGCDRDLPAYPGERARRLEVRLKLVQLLEKKKESSPVLLLEQYRWLGKNITPRPRTTIRRLPYLKNILELDPQTSSPWISSSTATTCRRTTGGDGYARRVIDAVKAKKEFEWRAGLPAEGGGPSTPPRRSSSTSSRISTSSPTSRELGGLPEVGRQPLMRRGGERHPPSKDLRAHRPRSIRGKPARSASSWRRSGAPCSRGGSDAPSVWGGAGRPPWSPWAGLLVTMEVLGPARPTRWWSGCALLHQGR